MVIVGDPRGEDGLGDGTGYKVAAGKVQGQSEGSRGEVEAPSRSREPEHPFARRRPFSFGGDCERSFLEGAL